jgi:hypothetical protein
MRAAQRGMRCPLLAFGFVLTGAFAALSGCEPLRVPPSTPVGQSTASPSAPDLSLSQLSELHAWASSEQGAAPILEHVPTAGTPWIAPVEQAEERNVDDSEGSADAPTQVAPAAE